MLNAEQVDFIHHIVETVVNTLSIVFNSLLLYLVVNHSSFGTPFYQILFAVDATLDLALAVIALVGQTVVITGDGYLIYISNGFLAGWSHRLDLFLNFAWLWVLHLNMMWIPVHKTKARMYNVLIALGTVTWASIGFTMTYIYSHSEKGFQEQGRHVLAVNEWDVSDKTITVGSKLSEWMLQSYLAMWFFTCLFAISIVITVEVSIKQYFGKFGGPSHEFTKKLHTAFHRALLAMAITPLVTTTGPILYYITACLLELSPGPMQCFIAVACTSITMFNPLTTIFAMPSYRNAVFNPCSTKKTRVAPNVIQVKGVSTATSRS